MRKGKSNETKSSQSDRGSGTQGVAQATPGDLSIPTFLLRADTPESKAARERLTKDLAHSVKRIAPDERAERCEADEKAIAELASGIASTKKAKAYARISKLIAKKSSETAAMPLQGKEALKAIQQEANVPKAGPKEKALQEQRVNGGKKKTRAERLADLSVVDLVKAPDGVPVSTPGTVAFGEAMAKLNGTKTEPTPVSKASKPKEATVKTATAKKPQATTTPAAKPAARKAANGNARTPVKKGKMQLVEEMLLTKKGATREEMSKLSGWPYVNLDMQLQRYRKRFPKAKLVEQNGNFRLIV